MYKEQTEANSDDEEENAETATTPTDAYIITGRRIVQTVHLIWIDSTIDRESKECQKFLADLQRFVDTIDVFTDIVMVSSFLRSSKTRRY